MPFVINESNRAKKEEIGQVGISDYEMEPELE